MSDVRFIETPYFPIKKVNEASASEKGPGRPDFWEMVFWWTRKPLASARAVIAGSLLPADFSQGRFVQMLKLHEKAAHRKNPKIPEDVHKSYFKGKKLLDPFAGFGSIPLEAARLGIEATAVELLPTAYVFLKAVLEYPAKYGEQLIDDVRKWGEWIIEQLKNDSDIKDLYDEDVAVYIGTWEVKCPAEDHYTPLIGNFWLARIKDKKGYKRLAWMVWRDNKIEVIDFNKLVSEELKQTKIIDDEADKGKRRIRSCTRLEVRVKTKDEVEEEGVGGEVEYRGKKYIVPAPNVNARSETARCLNCDVDIDHRVVDGKVLKLNKKLGEWYVRWAIKKWNEMLERYLDGEIDLETLLRDSPARPTILVKVKIDPTTNDLEFEPATKEDTEKLWKALEKVRELWQQKDPDIPMEPFAPYGFHAGGQLSIPVWGFDKFFKLFNPRQLLTMIKLSKLIREVGKRVEEEKVKEGQDGEEAYKYAEAISIYLAIVLVNHVRHNSIVTSVEPTRKFVAHALAFRGIAMTWNWVEEYPFIDFIGSLSRSIESIINGLIYLTSVISSNVSNSLPSKFVPKVILGDAVSLSLGEEFDVIVTDPPYAADVMYTELSDFYYVWLKRALSDSDNSRLIPRFIPEAFFDELGEEIEVQWRKFAKHEVSENVNRWDYFNIETSFDDLLSKAFSNLLTMLKPDGRIVTYYVAKKPEAWFALIKALWQDNGLEMTAAYPIETEAEERVTGRGKSVIQGGFVSVWKRRETASVIDIGDPTERQRLIEEIAHVGGETFKYIVKYEPKNAHIYMYLAGLKALTKYDKILFNGMELDVEGVVLASVGLGLEAMFKAFGLELKDTCALAYLLLKIAVGSKGKISSSDLAYIQYATGLRDVDMIKMGLIEEIPTRGPRVAKEKQFKANIPTSENVNELLNLASKVRGKCVVLEAFREMQIAALSPTGDISKVKLKYDEDTIREAMSLANALVHLSRHGIEILDSNDIDVKLSRMITGFTFG